MQAAAATSHKLLTGSPRRVAIVLMQIAASTEISVQRTPYSRRGMRRLSACEYGDRKGQERDDKCNAEGKQRLVHRRVFTIFDSNTDYRRRTFRAVLCT